MRVLVIDRGADRVSALSAVLNEAGFKVVGCVGEHADLYAEIDRLAPDAVIVDADSPSRDVLEDVATYGEHYPKPLLLLSSSDDRSLMAQAAQVGIGAYVVDGLSPALVRSLVDVTVRQYREMASLRRELAQTRETLADRQVIDRAKCLLMESAALTEQQAYRRLRQHAMDRGLPLPEVARQVMIEAARSGHAPE